MNPTATRRPDPPAHCDPEKPFVDVLQAREGQALAITWHPFRDDFNPTAGIVVIDGPRDRTRYSVTEFVTSWGRGFYLHKFESKPGAVTGTDKTAEGYSCLVTTGGAANCECKGFQRFSYCRHSDSVKALIANGWL